MQDFIRIHEKDNVAVALRDIPAGTRLDIPAGGGVSKQGDALKESGWSESGDAPAEGFRGEDRDAERGLAECGDRYVVVALEPIPAGHKMAIRDIPAGGQVVKYGCQIGRAKEAIRAGAWVHVHNLGTALGDLLEYVYEPTFGQTGTLTGTDAVFMGFRRPDGKVGIRNEIWIIPTVGCVNNVAARIAKEANDWLSAAGTAAHSSDTGAARPLTAGPGTGPGQAEGGTVDEVIAFSHPYGCSQMGEDQECTRRILADLVNHPNAGGVLVLGLGCENSNIDVLKPYIMEERSGGYDKEEVHSRVKFLVAQEWEDEVARGLEIVKGLIEYASAFRREPVSAGELVIGLKCGGSDGLSGITANPLVGRFSDRLVAAGGTTILTEVPEMFGAETILMNRCANEELFRQTVTLINDFKNYFKSHGQTIYENPSPGNKKGGISTLEDKSLGCTQKSGSALVQGVLGYGDRVQAKGLNLLNAPGNDLVASTALAAAGAHMVLFTTGRGTPFACPVPTVKISTNSALAGKKPGWIDFNAGVLAEDGDMEAESERLFRYVMEVASGRKVRSEEAGYHDMAIFKQGVTL